MTVNRRMLLWGAVSATVIVVLLLRWHDPAQAHSGVSLTVHHDGHGAVSVDVAWQDGHPVGPEVTVAATMIAVSAAGGQLGPVGLTRLPGQSTVVYSGLLAPGDWVVTVDTAVPGIGHCEARLQVGSAGTPSSTRCGATPEPVPVADTSPDSSGDGLATSRLLAGVALAGGLLVATATGLLLLRNRR